MKNLAEGTITNIQRYSVHDGPGIRTIVFFKGCPLRCKWCQNPETNTVTPSLVFFKDKCLGCRTCLGICPTGAVYLKDDQLAYSRSLCVSCGACADRCPSLAREIVGRVETVESIFKTILRDKIFFDMSGGGITLSGGEPLMQPAFARDLLQKSKSHGIHTAIETCGYAEWGAFEMVECYTDLFLYDVKVVDADSHHHYTGVRNEKILNNLMRLAEKRANIVLRVPFIPGVNSSTENLESLSKIAKECNALEIHLLPFHQAGQLKWESLGESYSFASQKLPSEEEINAAAQILKKNGHTVCIGGSGVYKK